MKDLRIVFDQSASANNNFGFFLLFVLAAIFFTIEFILFYNNILFLAD